MTGLNQIGLTNDGNKLLLTNGTSIFEYTASTEAWETTARATPAVPNTMGGVNPTNGIFYFGGQAAGGGNNFVFKTFDPATNTLATTTIPVTADAPPGGNGDLAFDSLGNMYFVASSAAAGQIYRVDAAQLNSGGGAAVKIGPQIATGVALNSMAFAKDGFLYVAGGGANGFLRVNPITGTVLDRKTLDVAITDLGSRSLPFTGSVKVDLPGGRVNDTDQFTVTIGGGGISTGNSATTTGDEASVAVGPLLILPGETYTVQQTPVGTTNPALYETSWNCVDPATGTVVASGPGASGSFTIPEGVQNVACTFTTAPYPAPGAVNDESLKNVQGSAVKVPVLGNDKGDLDPTTVKFLDGDGKPVTKLVVAGQGTWTVDPATGEVTFTPESGFSGNPTPVTYQVNDVRGNTTEATVTVTYVPGAVNDESLKNVQGSAVKVPVLGNDKGDLDPTTVKFLDGDGKPVTKLVVAGQGTWTVDPATGEVTFTPESGFSGNPTPVTYQVNDVRGNTTEATVTVTYVPGAVNDESLKNVQGSAVKVPVLGNDKGDLDPTTVKFLDGDGKPVTKLVVAGQGTWTVDPATGEVTFTPESGFSGNPTPVTYQVNDVRGNTTEATVTVTYVPGAVNDESLKNVQGSAVKVPVLGNDKGDLDPTTVKFLDGDGKPVTKLVVAGQGTWTVDPATGEVTFTPESGFSGNPTPVTYQVNDVRGNTTEATVTVTYVPGAVKPVTPSPSPGAVKPATPVLSPGAVSSPTPAPEASSPPLASTGVQAFGIGVAGLAIALMGGALLIIRRRRTQG
ncbi:hypothetical protein AL755_04285 [Arthrobacter sp. ERGS1:01]|nr:hypothetical protein AL755_04285 [Arthrobacter sp. ERGS1:01]